jgi:hypothetical protein
MRHLLLSSAVILASYFTFATSANAQVASGQVATYCDFSNPKSGGLILNPAGTILSSEGGTPAQVKIYCNGDATLTISSPLQMKGSSKFLPLGLSARASNKDLGLNVTSSSPTPGNIFADSEFNAEGIIEVNMTASHEQRISPGEYEFQVTLTSTP